MIQNSDMGQGPIEATVQRLVDPIIVAMMPRLKEVALQAAVAAEPVTRRVIREDVLPRVGLAVVLGLVAVGVLSAAVGSHYATRRRNNPARVGYRRRAA